MKNILKLEEEAQFLLALYLNSLLPYSWWWYLVWLLAPDLSMLGYLVNTRVGAATYNFAHHKGVALVCYFAGIYISSYELQFAGLLLFGHSAMDRVFGYGLKYADSFKNTHLGRIGRD